MPVCNVPDAEVVEIMTALGIDPKGYAVTLQNEDTIALIHYRTHLEVTIRKGVKKEWLLTKRPLKPE